MGKKIFVEVCNATDLMPKDGEGSASPYCVLEFDGQRRRTEPKNKDLKPAWNTVLEFAVEGEIDNREIEITVLSDKKTAGKQRPQFLGRVRIPAKSAAKKGEETIVFYPLGKRSFFSHVKGELGIKLWWSDEPDPPPPEEGDGESKKAEEGEAKIEDGEKKVEENADADAAAAATDASSSDPEKKQEEAIENKDGGGDGEKKEVEEKKEDQEKKAEDQETKKDDGDGGEKKDAEPVKEEGEAASVAVAAAAAAPAAEEKKEEEKKEPKGGGDGGGGEPRITTMRSAELVRPPPRPSRPTIVPAGEFVLKETKPLISNAIGEKVVTFDLVEKMQYLFVRVVKARALAAPSAKDGGAAVTTDPYVKITLGSHSARTRSVPSTLYPEWNEVFAFGKERMGGPALEIAVWDGRDDQSFLGSVVFEFAEIPVRVPPDSPLAPQWYRLERKSHGHSVRGDMMLAVWLGTQADEAFTEAWQSDSGGFAHTRSKVYLSPKLWYLRVNVIEAQEVHLERFQPEVTVRAHIGFQVQRTRAASNRSSTSPFWNEDLLFVAAEPFEDDLVLRVEERKAGGDKDEFNLLGFVRIGLGSVEKRLDHRQVSSRWYNLDKNGSGDEGGESEKKTSFHGRLHLRVCLDGGYHVLDEPVNHLSCVNPTARQLWRSGVGVLELGIIRGKDVFPMKNNEGRGSADAYVVAKYGSKWVRTRTVKDSLNPRWNEQYRWDVHDPCTVLTIGVFDNAQLHHDHDHVHGSNNTNRDARIGKVRIRLSTLESDRVYTNRYPLLSLQQSGVKKLGEIELAVRFTSASSIAMLHLYFQPLLPRMHYLHPLGITQAEILRISAMRIVAIRLARSEPPLRQEVVQYMLDTDVNVWSLRRSKVNYFRLMNVLNGPLAVLRWLDNICHWRNPVTTVLVHVLFLILVWYPELILPTLFLYMFLIGLWQYRSRPRSPPSMEARLSQAEVVEPDELDEEFDPIPSAKDPNVIRARYDRVRIVAARIQNVLGDLATQGERMGALLSWRDPRATAIFVAFSLVVAVVLYVVPMRVIVVVAGLYAMRHPRFRDPMPAAPLSFFRRLPSLADRIL